MVAVRYTWTYPRLFILGRVLGMDFVDEFGSYDTPDYIESRILAWSGLSETSSNLLSLNRYFDKIFSDPSYDGNGIKGKVEKWLPGLDELLNRPLGKDLKLTYSVVSASTTVRDACNSLYFDLLDRHAKEVGDFFKNNYKGLLTSETLGYFYIIVPKPLPSCEFRTVIGSGSRFNCNGVNIDMYVNYESWKTDDI